MSKLTRRKFLAQASLGAAAAGGLAGGLATAVGAVPPLTGLIGPGRETTSTTAGGRHLESVVAHVRDVATGEVAVMAGTSEFVYRDPELTERLMRAARSAVKG